MYQIFFLLILPIFLFVWIRSWISPTIQDRLSYQARVLAVAAIHQTVTEELDRMGVTYHQMIRLTRDGTGRVTSLQTDAVLLNKIKSAVTEKAGEKLQGLSSHTLSIPLGSLTGLKFLSGRGPAITFRLHPEGVVITNLYHQFTQAGVNQTLHRVWLQIDAEISAVIPGFSMKTGVSTNIELGETVIVGEVPEFFGQIGLGAEDSTS